MVSVVYAMAEGSVNVCGLSLGTMMRYVACADARGHVDV